MSEFIRGRISESGRVVLPAELRKECGIEDGKEVIFSRTEFGIQITPLDLAVSQAQALASRFIPADRKLVTELRQARDQDGTFA